MQLQFTLLILLVGRILWKICGCLTKTRECRGLLTLSYKAQNKTPHNLLCFKNLFLPISTALWLKEVKK